MRRVILSLALLMACGDDDDEKRPGLDAGSIDGGLTPDGGPDAGADASLDAATPTLCAKYGGATGIERAIKRHVLEELATDCRVGVHFTLLPTNRLARFSDCLTYQTQELFGCPGVTYAGSKSPNGLPCRDMKTAHAGLGLSAGDFDAVLSDVASGLLKAGVSQADIDKVAPALLGFEPDIIESSALTPTRSCDHDGGVDAGG